MSGDSFIEALSTAQPIPGGGAAAAHGALIGLALLEKIIRIEVKRSGERNDLKQIWGQMLQEVHRVASDLLRLRDEDGRAYLALAGARSSAKRGAELRSAIHAAISCPSQIMERVLEVLPVVSECGKRCKRHLVSDLQVACELLGAAVEGAFFIAAANLVLIDDTSERVLQQNMLHNVRDRARDACHTVREELSASR